jgi:hypothetical protein
MDDDLLLVKLNSLSEIVGENLDELIHELDRFQIALSGTLRLMDGKSSTLTTLHGDKNSLMSYILQQTTEIKQNSTKRLENILEEVTRLITAVSDGDRNS